MKTLEVDIIKLYSGQIEGFKDHSQWNAWLTKCLSNENLNELVNVRKGLQMGMSSAQKKGLVTDALASTFLRWNHSVELTIKRIIKKRKGKLDIKGKKQLDVDIEEFLRRESF